MKVTKMLVFLGAILLCGTARPESVLFTSDAAIGCANTAYEGYDVTVSGCTLTVACEHSFHSLALVNGGAVTHASEDTGGVHLNIATSVRVDSGCQITASERGWGPWSGPGTGGECWTCRSYDWVCVQWEYDEEMGWYCVDWGMQCVEWGSTASGGGHGGEGGPSDFCEFGGEIPGGATYGSETQPSELGSSGGGSLGGAGGGAIRVYAADSILVNGSIMANGQTGGWSWPYFGGGGSGGSICLICGALSGNGAVAADGGEAGLAGGGGGGRIALYYCSRTLSQESVHAYGGWGGAPGTVYDGSPEGPDCNSNDVPDFCDIAEGTSLDQNGNGIPDECEAVGSPVLVVQFTPDSRLMLSWTAVAGFSEYIVYGKHAEDAAVPLGTVNVLEYDASGLLSGGAPQRWLFHVVGTRE